MWYSGIQASIYERTTRLEACSLELVTRDESKGGSLRERLWR